MTTRCSIAIRAMLITVAAVALWCIPTGTHAQQLCACDQYTFKVDGSVACDVTLCWTFSPDGPVFCGTVSPGHTFGIPCPVYQAYIQTCTGQYTLIGGNPWISRCAPDLQIGRACCVRVCQVNNGGCINFSISAVPCLGIGC